MPGTELEAVDHRTDLVIAYDDAFEFAERICRSNLVPAAYRGKPAEAVIAIMHGADVGLSAMASLQRVVVVEGKPTLDAQGILAKIRSEGHSVIEKATSTKCWMKGTRADNGDTCEVEFGEEDAKRAGLSNKGTYKGYPSDMYHARCASRLGRRLFPDLLQGFSYETGEARDIPDRERPAAAAPPPLSQRLMGPARVAATSDGRPVTEDGEIEDAEEVDGEQSMDHSPSPDPPPDAEPSREQWAALVAVFIEAGLEANEARRQAVERVLGHKIDSPGELTSGEVRKVTDTLRAEVAAKASAAEDDHDPEPPEDPGEPAVPQTLLDEVAGEPPAQATPAEYAPGTEPFDWGE